MPANGAGGAGPAGYCCRGCAAARAIIDDLGLDRYYERRVIDPSLRPVRPDSEAPVADCSAHVVTGPDGTCSLDLMVDGLHCAACVWLIERVLSRLPGVTWARVNLGSRRLTVRWRQGEADAGDIVGRVSALGYRLVPFDPAMLDAGARRRERELLTAMGVAGFAAANIMLLSVSIWAGHFQDMGPATRGLLQWISALIAIPAVGWAGRPFFRPALAALRAGHVNMDVPISLAVVLATGMSLFEAARGGEHVWFDSAVTLLFFLLVGRFLDARARGRARSAAGNLLALGARAVTVVAADGSRRMLPPGDVDPGMTVLVATGEAIGVDGRIATGRSEVDGSAISGETVPQPVRPGDPVFAGMINIGGPLRIAVEATGEGTLLAEVVRLMETAEAGRSRHVALADRVARLYAPVVHLLAFGAFAGWWLLAGATWQAALMTAVSVLVITCPCALALAVPAVQVIASGRLMRRGILLRSATALERLAEIDTVVFDKTGTLTTGRPELIDAEAVEPDDLALAAGLAVASGHPLARALVRAAPTVALADDVREEPGSGLVRPASGGEIRLGSRRWCGVAGDDGAVGPELWLARPDADPVRFGFADTPRADAAVVIRALVERGIDVRLLSGDRAPTVAAVAGALGIDDWLADCSPVDKVHHLQALAAAGRRVLMVGDGLNDAPALAAAYVSLSPSTAADITRNSADAIFQGDLLQPVTLTLSVARRSGRLVRQNLGLALVYNALTIPLAVAGLVTPLFAAIAMSASSLAVVGNALRLTERRR